MARKKKHDYFQSYCELAKLAVQESDYLIESLKTFTTAAEMGDVIERVHELENAGDLINHELYSAVAVDFMPPIDREDVVELASALDNVLDYIEDVIDHMYMYDIHVIPPDALRFADIIKKSCEALDRAMVEFHNFKRSKEFKRFIVEINTYEEEADVLNRDVMRHLHTVENDEVMHVLVWSRIYERMEKCCDACEHAADIMSTILLKNV
ncbi:MAG: DUF47 family protein [Eggerthellaceae bacterium]|jgi:predicted phosphate transport protein (TIGR00153 family)|nr:DUF47 family protein [Eggerthellaceae bacterium]